MINAYLDHHLLQAMEVYSVPVVGYVVIDEFRISHKNTLSFTANSAVSVDSLFQSASISKMLTSLGALKLVEEGIIDLEETANHYLSSWKIPENKYNKNTPVLVKHLLNMTSGLSISNFDGYRQDEPMPTLLQLLKGAKPANNIPVEVLYQPGSKYGYSNGGFQVLQLIMEEKTGIPFSEYQNTRILNQLNMEHSLYESPLRASLVSQAVPAFVGKEKIAPGGWNNYAGLAACGMWSTPNDIAKFMLNLTNSYLNKQPAFLSHPLAIRMLSRQENTPFGFGGVISGHGTNLNFAKTGHTRGYQSLLIMFPHLGKGAVVMTNAESGDILINYFIAIIAQQFHWPYYFPFFDESIFLPDY